MYSQETLDIAATMETTKDSFHLRIDLHYDESEYITYLEKLFEVVVIGLENKEKAHFHCYLDKPFKPIKNFANLFTTRFPLNRDRKYSYKKCKTCDWTNLRYCVKEKNCRKTLGVSEELVAYAMSESYSKEVAPQHAGEPKYARAKREFNEAISCGILSKDYSRIDVLNFSVKWYMNTGPFEEQHAYRLYNYLMGETKYAAQRKSEIVSSIIQKYNLQM